MNGQSDSRSAEQTAGMSAERLADLAHELRAPLGGIDAMVTLLSESRALSDQEKLIEGLKAASAHLRSVANSLLQPKDGSARTVAVEDSLRLFAVAAASRAAARGLRYRQSVADGCGQAIVADGMALRQILENLVDNAVRHAEGGDVVVNVSATTDAGQGRALRFEVVNRGAVLGARELEALFLRQAATADRPAGNGLGLSIVAGLVARAGGTCGAVNLADGAGLSVWFTLPVTGTAASRATSAAIEAPPAPRMLVVEDDATNQLLLKTVLEHMGYSVDTTGSPRDALKRLAGAGYAAVFTDMSMPEMDGTELIRAIRGRAGPSAKIPVICVTGRVLPEDMREVLAAGGNWVVRKPITIHDLRQALIATGLRDPMARQVTNAA